MVVAERESALVGKAQDRREIVDTVDLSPEGEAVVETGVVPTGPGNSSNSPAHQARALLASAAAAAGDTNIPFGHLVRDIARGIEPSVFAEPPVTDEGGDGIEAAGDEVPVVDDGTTTDGGGTGEETPLIGEIPVIDDNETGDGGLGDTTPDAELLAEMTLMEQLLDAEEDEEETLLS